VRSLGKISGFSLIVISVLALGIGANTACSASSTESAGIPFPFAALDRLVEISALDAICQGQKPQTARRHESTSPTHVPIIDPLNAVEIWQMENFRPDRDATIRFDLSR